MDTTLTSGNLQSFLRLLDEKKVTSERFTQVLASGVLADVFDVSAKLHNRGEVSVALGLSNHPALITAPGLSELSTWKTLERKRYVGSNDPCISYIMEINKKRRLVIEQEALSILRKANWEEGPSEVQLARIRLPQIGLDPTKFKPVDVEKNLDWIYGQAREHKLTRLPMWAIAQLRDEYDQQPSGERINTLVPESDIGSSRSGHCVFQLRHEKSGNQWLLAYHDDHINLQIGSPETLWTFVKI